MPIVKTNRSFGGTHPRNETRRSQRFERNAMVSPRTLARMGKGGRPPGRPLRDIELRHLQLLLEVRKNAHLQAAGYDERLEDYAYDLRQIGVSTRRIAEAAGVAVSTVQTWATNAKRRRPVE